MSNATVEAKAKLNKFEKLKAQKDGLAVQSELIDFANRGWEAIDKDDRDVRLKWLGIFFRPVTPGKFMLRLRMPSGVITSGQMRVLGEIVQRYGDDGNADITTRQNLQLRGIRIEDIPSILDRMHQHGLTSIQSGMDNVRNITASPVAGLDADELIDTRGLVQKVQDMITNNSQGNPAFTNLPRKFNIAIAGCRDNSVHAEINDIAFVPAYKDENLGFNVLVGGFFSAQRCAAAIPLDVWVQPDEVVGLCEAILVLFRDHGSRGVRQKTRLMWLIEEWGVEKFRSAVANQMGKTLERAAPQDEILWEKRDHIGIHAQKQPGLNYVGLHVPVGRLFSGEMLELARIADVYGSGELRLTVEQNLILPNVPDSRLPALLAEPILQVFSVNPEPLTRAVVSCTGNQFCNFALIETKNRAVALINELAAELQVSKPVRIHWTGCPNSCGQPQVADIGLMGTKARKDGQTVEAVDLFMGGTVGKDAHLGTCVQKAIPCDELKEVLRSILIQNFGAVAKVESGFDPACHNLDRQRTQFNGAHLNGQLDQTIILEPVTDFAATAMPPIPEAVANPPATPVVVRFNRSGKDIEGNSSLSLLEIAESAGIDLESSCRSGSCGTCKVHLLEGDIAYDGDPEGLEEDEQGRGVVLGCIAKPQGAVTIDL
ncbi:MULTISPECIES: ferredoxin--nitrite reductase [Oscillatoriophycideae]|uniref:Ferredoxin--nitrite reductase n=2 Tax=Lyngbya TaxID=28073 RepID=A0ABD4T481_9CYAN|nr:ferredoxin--nitrite reductase [Lyngbya confervoides]MCM1983484.1 ferredoxin--nitrite reductase [Lyngbya confervoides BDU141951]